MYALIENNSVKKYPYSITDFRFDNPNISIPLEPSKESLAQHGIIEIVKTDKPSNDITKNILEETPIFINGQWTQKWSINDASESEIISRKLQLREAAKEQRSNAYREESDPLFFKAQRGESTMEEWAAKVAEIKSRYPKE